jgi:magnesium-transporting ATPase (P-type)
MAPTKKSLAPATDRHPFLLSYNDVASQLQTNLETGLTSRQVQDLRAKCPENVLDSGGGVSWYRILLKQISNAMILVCLLICLDRTTPQTVTDTTMLGPRLCHGPLLWRRRLH